MGGDEQRVGGAEGDAAVAADEPSFAGDHDVDLVAVVGGLGVVTLGGVPAQFHRAVAEEWVGWMVGFGWQFLGAVAGG